MPGTEAAFANLDRGIRFVRANAHPTGQYATRVLANHLRELDRLLSLLIDAVSREMIAARRMAGYFPPQRNTAAKYARLCTLLAQPNPEDDRLRAIGRSRNCLFYTGGIVRLTDRRDDGVMTAGWPGTDGELRRFPLGATMTFGKDDMHSVCNFLDQLSRKLLALRVDRSFSPDQNQHHKIIL